MLCDKLHAWFLTQTQLAFYVNLHRAVIGPSATLTGRWRPDIDLRRMLSGDMVDNFASYLNCMNCMTVLRNFDRVTFSPPICFRRLASDYHGPTCVFHLLWLETAIEPFTLFYCSFYIICVLKWYFSYEVEDRTHLLFWGGSEIRARVRQSGQCCISQAPPFWKRVRGSRHSTWVKTHRRGRKVIYHNLIIKYNERSLQHKPFVQFVGL